MSNKPTSTIGAKPAIDPALQWIGAAPETKTPAPEEIAIEEQDDKPTKQLVDKQTIMQASQTASQQKSIAEEPTAMLSARVPVALIKKLRIRAATEERHIQEILADLLRDYLGER